MGMGAVAPDGTYAVEHVPPGPVQVMLQVGTEESFTSAAQSRQVEVREGETATADFLLREILVSGTVTRRGEPAPGVRITLRGMRMAFFGGPPAVVPAPPVGPQRGWAVTRPDGSYELLLDDPGTYMVMASSPDGRVNYPMRTVEVADADASTVDLAYGGVRVAGQVVDAETSAPVPASIFAAPASGQDRRPSSTQAGADGRFQLEVDPGELDVSASAKGYAAARTRVSVGESGVGDVRLALARGASISGRVLDTAGRAVPALMVTAHPAGDSPGAGPASRMGFGRSAPDGTFTIGSLSEGRYAVSAGDELAGYGTAPDVAAGSTGVVLRLQPGGRVRATVLRPDGSPASAMFVMVAKVDGRPGMGWRPGQTDAAGVAELATPAGTIDVRAGDALEEGLASVAVSAGETALVEIRLKPRTAPGTR
jgi:hypothetical protein